MKLRLSMASENELGAIHEASLKILNDTGCEFHHNDALDIFKNHGARLNGKTVYIDKQLVEKTLASVPRTFTWRARNADFSTVIGKGGFRLAPNAGIVNVMDMDAGHRPAKLEDVAKIQSIHQMSEVVDFVGNNPCDPSDIDPFHRHLYVTYETLKHTDKPLISYFAPYHDQADETLQMVNLAFGEDDLLKNHHVVGTSLGTSSPLSYSADALGVIKTFASHNQPVLITSAIMGGITGPLDLMGIALQQNVELLAGTVLIQLVNPGNPVVWSPSSTVAWLKTAAYSAGTPEAMLPNIIGLQMARNFYKIPTRCMAGITDSKRVDCQAGYETMQNLMLAMLGGAQIIYEALGVLGNIMTTSYEKIIIDEELYTRTARIHRGVDASVIGEPQQLIMEVGGDGEYLTHRHTLNHFRDMWQPLVSNWDNDSAFGETGSADAMAAANKIWKQRLAQAPETFLDSETEKDLKAFIESHI